ncbi:hypothetical protein ASG41_13030 [Modestobacter sp. Leaf380]|nr:hypothetical protein ASG41_13030 [Modestobacter sp. Leaf380]
MFSIILGMALDQAGKVRENRLRRMADRQGLKLVRNRRIDVRAIDYGLYWLRTQDGEAVTDPEGVSVDVIEERLTNPPPRSTSSPSG